MNHALLFIAGAVAVSAGPRVLSESYAVTPVHRLSVMRLSGREPALQLPVQELPLSELRKPPAWDAMAAWRRERSFQDVASEADQIGVVENPCFQPFGDILTEPEPVISVTAGRVPRHVMNIVDSDYAFDNISVLAASVGFMGLIAYRKSRLRLNIAR